MPLQPTKYLMFFGEVACHAQGLKNNSAECLLEALIQNCVAIRSDCEFKHKVRCADSDRHPSNDAAEGRMVSQLGCDWESFIEKCRAHKTFTAHSETLQPLEGAIKGLIHIGRCFAHAGMMSELRECLRVAFRMKARLRVGLSGGDDADLYRRVALRVMVATDGKASVRRVMLSVLPNGA